MSFPKVPGLISDYDPTKINHKMISHTHLEKIQNPKNKAVPLHALPHPPPMQPTHVKDTKSLSFSQSMHQNLYTGGVDQPQLFEPVYAQLDKQVLRFYGFFQQSVVESALESSRVRKIIILYYLQDHTLQISEPKQVNSGTPQGIFLKRQMVLKNDGDPISLQDLHVTGDIEIYGRIIHIYDCDQYTREFYANINDSQPASEPEPSDSFAKSQIKPVSFKDNSMKEFMEKSLGGGRVKDEKQFLDYDRKVLRFFATCDGLTYVIHYYRADDTIEIREVHFQNSGRDPFPLLFKRQKIPDQFEVGQPGLVNKSKWFTEDEFMPGESFNAFNHVFKIFGVDQSTHEYYKYKYQRHFEVSQIDQPRAPESKPLQIPPYNGFGNQQDTLGYVYRLIPKPPMKDYFKYVDNDKMILRYTAKLNTTVPEDFDRRFIIQIYLSDDTLSIYEPAQKNSGIKEGKFLERGKYKIHTGQVTTPGDLEIGSDITINYHNFRILSCDEYTQKWREQHLVD